MAQGDIIKKQGVDAHVRTSPVKSETTMAQALRAAADNSKTKEAS